MVAWIFRRQSRNPKHWQRGTRFAGDRGHPNYIETSWDSVNKKRAMRLWLSLVLKYETGERNQDFGRLVITYDMDAFHVNIIAQSDKQNAAR